MPPRKQQPMDQLPTDTELAVAANDQTLAVPPAQPEFDIDGFLAKRAEFITKVNAIMVEKKDYHIIQGKKSLAKGGAEKIASIFGWTARFEKDKDTSESFADIKGLVAFVCHLEKQGVLVGEGRGAATLVKNAGDPNKTIKMAQKSAFIDAVLRTSGLSDFFTQDLEDMNLDKPRTAYGRTNPELYQSLTKRLASCENESELDLIAQDVLNASRTGKITSGQLEMLREIGQSVRDKVIGHVQQPTTHDDVPFEGNELPDKDTGMLI